MFAKLTSAFTAFAILAVATAAPNNKPTTSAPAPSIPAPSLPVPSAPAPSAPAGGSGGGAGAGAGSCSTGALQCCESVQSANSAAVAPLLSLLGVVVQDLNIPVGLTCSGITGVGVGSANGCSANTVCCDDNSFGGLISLGCLPVSL